jgi:MSHA pilin protein MshD
MSRSARAHGVTLVELVVAIAIIGTGVAGILAVMEVTTRRSADPMIMQQAQLIAESYLEEILLKKFYDPDTNNVCPAPEASRADYDNVCDYNGLNNSTGALDQFGNTVSGLESYNVAVTVTADNTVTLGPPGPGEINNTGALRVLRVNVVVTHDNFGGVSVPLTGYRVNYNCNLAADPGCKPLTT